MKHQDHDAPRAFEASTLHAGCTGDCEWGEPCSCSHSALQPSRRPRQPRLPEPRTPHLPLWTRFKLWAFWSHPRIDWFETIIAVVALLVLGFLLVGAAVHGLGLLR